MREDFLILFELFMKINNKINQMQKKSVTFKNGIVLNTSMIHLIEAIGNNEDANFSDLANILGITRSAVSQQMPKLIDEALVIRYQKDSNEKEYFMKLTAKGKEIYDEHKDIHRQMNEKILNSLEGYTKEDIESFMEVFNIIDFYLDEYKDKIR